MDNFNFQLDINNIDYLFINPEDYNNSFLDLNKLIYNEEQIFEKYIKKEMEYLPIDRYEYLFKNLDDETIYVLVFK